MKRIVYQLLAVSIIGLLSMPTVYGQKKCKYTLDKKDPLSGERVRRATIWIGLTGNWGLSYYRKGDELRFELNLKFTGEQNFNVPAGSEVAIKLGNDEIMQLKSAKEANPVSYVNGTQIATNYAISYFVSREELGKLSDVGFKVVSVKLGGNDYLVELKEKKQTKMMAKAKCMLSD